MSDADWRAEVLKFWFGLDHSQWFRTDLELDHRIRQNFLKLWAQKRQLPANHFLTDALTALAGVLLFDQYPRNMFRNNAEQFATDTLALAIARGAVEKGLDEELALDERAFLYLPLEHSENIADQNRSVLLFTGLGDPHYLKFARLHHEIIEKFGRFPHRNAMLGRTPRSAEVASGNVVPW